MREVPLTNSIRFRFLLVYLVLIALVLVLLNTYPIFASQDLAFQSKQASLQKQATVIASALSGLEVLTEEGVQQVMFQLNDMNLSRIVVNDWVGYVLYDTQEGENTLYRYALFQEILSALSGHDVFRAEYSEAALYSRAAVPVIYRNHIIGSVYVYEHDTEQAALLQGIQGNLRNISLLISILVFLMSIFFSRALSRRIGDLLSAIRTVRKGEYGHRANLSGKDELAALSREFNQLTDRLQVTEELRRRFVSDASHELKTPLASIRLLADSIIQIEDMNTATLREFMTDIGEEAERLTRITEKLLALTQMDAAPVLESTPVDVKEVVNGVIHLLRPVADERRITLEANLTEGCIVHATKDALYQIFFNIIENAIKYNNPEGLVMITLCSQDGAVTLRVDDTGIGIPAADMPRVFERFYRVDRARSREAGGTGLGLSIASDTAALYQGTIRVEARRPKGSRFIVTFPADTEGTVK